MNSKEDKIAEITQDIEGIVRKEPSSRSVGDINRLSGAYYSRARAFYEKGNFSDAAVDYEKALGTGYQGAYDESFMQDNIAKCYAYSGFAKCQQGDWSRAFFDFERAFREASNADFIFQELLEDNPQSVVALILSILYEPGAWQLYLDFDKLLEKTKTSPQTAHNLLKHWPSTGRNYEAAQLLDAVACYDAGDVPGALQAVKNTFLIGATLANDKQEFLDEVNRIISSCRFDWQPLGCFAHAYLDCQQGNLVSSLALFEVLLKDYPNQPLVQEGINEVLQLAAPQAIERHIERREFLTAAYLAKRRGDFGRAGEWYEITAKELEEKEEEEEEEEKGDKELVADCYQNAAECFSNVGDEARARSCWRNVHRLRQQAKLKAVIDAPESLVVGEWDALSITVVNTGFGPAENLSAKVEGPVTVHNMSESNAIAAGERNIIEIAVRPDEPGRRVPITVQIIYHDSMGEYALPPITKLIPVSPSEGQ